MLHKLLYLSVLQVALSITTFDSIVGGSPSCSSLTSPYLLRADKKLDPALGTSLQPLFSWAVPVSQNNVSAVRVQVFDFFTNALHWDSQSVSVGQLGATPWSLSASAASLPSLSTGTPFLWRCSTADSTGAWTPWSINATLVTAMSLDLIVSPLWHQNSSAQLTLLRGEILLPPGARVIAAYAFATAQPQRSQQDNENGKLLGAYKLYVGGVFAGIGPGRPGRCGPVCPPPCECTPEHVYDTIDITALAINAVDGNNNNTIPLALQCFNAPGPDPSRVLVQIHVFITINNSSLPTLIIRGTGVGLWQGLDASAWMAPSCCTETAWFKSPQENWDARLEPIASWKTLPMPLATPWTQAAPATPFSIPLIPRPTLSLQITDNLSPFSSHLFAPGWVVYDFGREIQGGLTLTFPSPIISTSYAVQLGEELLPDGTVMFHMRTGNNYSSVFTTRNSSTVDIVMEHHEYMEFRYAQVVALGVGYPSTCAASTFGDYTSPIVLNCDGGSGSVIDSLSFASWGTPRGACDGNGSNNNDFTVDPTCDATGAPDVLRALCVGKQKCSFIPSDALLSGGSDPCHLTNKRVAIAAVCSSNSSSSSTTTALLPNVTAWQVFYPASFVGDASEACDGGASGTGESGGSVTGPQFVSSSDDLNKIFSLCEYTVRATNLDMVTDSNTRQRSPVCAEAALATSHNQGAASFEDASQAYLTDYMLTMSPPPKGAGWAEWQALLISSVAMLYSATGDIEQYNAHAPLLDAYLERELFSNITGLWTCDDKSWSCSKPEVDWPTTMRDGFVFVPTSTVVNAHYVGALNEFALLAEASGNVSAASAARAASVALAATMRRLLFNESIGGFVDGLGTTHAAVHSTVYALARGVLDGDPVMGAKAWALLLNRLDPILGIPVGPYPGLFFGEALFRNTSDHGRAAINLFLTNNGTNSWLNQLRSNATTTMEAWTPEEKPNLTWSHPWMAFPLQLIMEWLCGVQLLNSAVGISLRIQPQPGTLNFVHGSVPTLRGAVTVSLTQEVDIDGLATSFALNTTVPGALTAMTCLPLTACVNSHVSVDGKIQAANIEGDYACVLLESGPHNLFCPAT